MIHSRTRKNDHAGERAVGLVVEAKFATYSVNPAEAIIQISSARKPPGVIQRKPRTFAFGVTQYRSQS